MPRVLQNPPASGAQGAFGGVTVLGNAAAPNLTGDAARVENNAMRGMMPKPRRKLAWAEGLGPPGLKPQIPSFNHRHV